MLLGMAVLSHAQTTVEHSALATNAVAKVVGIRQPGAVEIYRPNLEIVRKMVAAGVSELTGKNDAKTAWLSLVTPQDIVGIKVFSGPGHSSGTRPAVVVAVIQGLIAAGVPARNIIVWDRLSADLRQAGFYELTNHLGIQVKSAVDQGYEEKVFYEKPIIGNLVYGDLEFNQKGGGVGRKSFVTRLLTREITKIISIAPLLNHNHAGVAGHLYSLAMGSVDNTLRFDEDRLRLSEAVPEIVNMTEIYDRLVLCITDALICQYQGEQRSLLHYSTSLGELRFSRDPVALDVLSVQELNLQRTKAGFELPKGKLELYPNAALLQLGISDTNRIQTTWVPAAKVR